MDAFLEAIMSKDLVKAEKAFGAIMAEKTMELIEKEKVNIARAIMIEGEESEEDEDESEEDDDEDDSDDKDDKSKDKAKPKDKEDE